MKKGRFALASLVAVAACAASAIIAACGAFDDADSAPAAADTGADGSIADSPGTTDGSGADAATDDAPKDAGSGAVYSDDFEKDAPLCGTDWQVFQATANWVSGAGIDGGGACRVCVDPGYGGLRREVVGFVVGKRYYTEVYLRLEQAPDAGQSTQASVFVYVRDGDGGELGTNSSYIAVDTSWKQHQLNFTSTSASIAWYVSYQTTPDKSCFLVDRMRIVPNE